MMLALIAATGLVSLMLARVVGEELAAWRAKQRRRDTVAPAGFFNEVKQVRPGERKAV